jgi:NAD(P)-dependent dehydrogenase (short-subunit alcohol dehydrogenase family)
MDLAASGLQRFCIVVATVGGSRSRGFLDTDADAFMDTVAYNVRSAYIAIREGVRRIERDGAFAFISSTAADDPVRRDARLLRRKGRARSTCARRRA